MCVVETRAGRSKRIHPLVLPQLNPLSVTPDEFCRLQKSCPSLNCLQTKATTREVEKARDGATYQFIYEDDLLYQKCLSSDRPQKVHSLSLIVPSDCCPVILSVVHEGSLARHFSHQKTQMKTSQDFYWPGMYVNIRDYCRSCDKCQRMSAKGRIHP